MKFTTLTRYKITTYVLLFLALMSMAAMVKGMEALSITAITGMMTTLSTYIWAQTRRPSMEIINDAIKELEHDKDKDNDE